MRYLVAYVADQSGADALALARMLASSQGADLTVCLVLPLTGGLPSDVSQTGYENLMREKADEWLEQARVGLGADADAEFLAEPGPTPMTTLLRVAGESTAAMIVLGSAGPGVTGRFVPGSVAGQLLRSSPVPLAFAPRGFSESDDLRLRRVTCGLDDLRNAGSALESAAQLCRRDQLPLRLVTFSFPEQAALGGIPGMGNRPDEAEQAERKRALELAAAGLTVDLEVSTDLAAGPDVEGAFSALDWSDGDLLVIGSSRQGPVARVLLGSTAQKLLRAATVPVLAVPRGADLDLEHTAPIPVTEPDEPSAT